MVKNKLKNLLSLWPANAVAVVPWLQKHGISQQLAKHYLENGWLEGIRHGAYKRKGDKTSWQGAVFALQQGLALKMHVGGLTALDLMGGSHFVSRGKFHLDLFNSASPDPRRLLPRWLTEGFAEECQIYYHRHALFTSELGLQTFSCGNFNVLISSRERALLEILSLVPKKMSFEHAVLLFQGKSTLRSHLLQRLLESSTSQQTNRLFLHLAKKFQYPFIEELNIKAIPVGQGKRVVGQGEVFDETLNLYVPKLKDDKDQMIGI